MPLIKNVNELTSRIHFKQPKYGKNKIGDTVVIGYEDKATIWGKVLKRSVTNTYTGGANWADNKVQVAIRHYQKIVISHGDYLTFDFLTDKCVIFFFRYIPINFFHRIHLII